MDDETSWYGACLIFEANHPEEWGSPTLYEQSIILVRATSDEDAFAKASGFGKTAEHGYLNVYGKRVIWRLKEVLHVVEVIGGDIGEGSEVYSKFLGRCDLRQLRRMYASGRLLRQIRRRDSRIWRET